MSSIKTNVFGKENRFAARLPLDFDQRAAEVLRGSRTILCGYGVISVLVGTPANPIANSPSAAVACRKPKFRKNICTLSIRITRFMIFKSPALSDLVSVTSPLASERSRKSRLLWPFANQPSSLSSMVTFIFLPLVLVYTRLRPHQWVASRLLSQSRQST